MATRLRAYKGVDGKIEIGGVEVGYVQRCTAEVNNNATPYFEYGERFAHDIPIGHHQVEGTIERFWVSKEMLEYATGSGGVLPSKFNLTFYPGASSSNSKPYVVISGVQINTASVEMSAEDFATEQVNFVAIMMDSFGSGQTI